MRAYAGGCVGFHGKFAHWQRQTSGSHRTWQPSNMAYHIKIRRDGMHLMIHPPPAGKTHFVIFVCGWLCCVVDWGGRVQARRRCVCGLVAWPITICPRIG
jgi:hypothetical protein